MITVADRNRRAGQQAAETVVADINVGMAKPGAVPAALMALLDDAGLRPVPPEVADRLEGFGLAIQRALALKAAG